MSNTLWSHGLQHARLPSPSPSPRVCSNSCPMSQWCQPTISPSVVSSSCLQSFPALGSFPISWLFASSCQIIGASPSASVSPMSWLLESDGQSIGDSASASVLPKNIQDWFPLGWTGWISWQSKGLSRQYTSQTSQFKSINSFTFNFLYGPTLTSKHDYLKTIALTRW